ncbi:MAG: Mur ligase family protein [Caldisericia bacterium]|jgi:UDP-N-acetylmuramoyl-L-alanyl-D-glutamate--2,6-diaminopimelate ligase|nr:Mur ligase family protein [Caldisericia bacterium]
MKRLSEILNVIDYKKVINFKDHEIENLAMRINEIKENTLYFLFKGRTYDGTKNYEEASINGVKAFISDREFEIKEDTTLIVVNNVRDVLYKISCFLYDNPSQKMNVFGITGSSGKTSVVTILKNIFPYSSSISSLGVEILNEKVYEPETTQTTPESHYIQRYLNLALKRGSKNFIIETSSFALKDKRVFGIDFKASIFLNFSITHHLKIHGTILDYLNSKILLKSLTNGPFLINSDSPYSYFFKKDSNNFYFSYKEKKDFSVVDYEKNKENFKFTIKLLEKTYNINLKDEFDIYPVLPSLSLAYLTNLNIEEAISKIENMNLNPSGRWVVLSNDPFVVVDKSNTPLSIEFLVQKIKKIPFKRKFVLFSFFEEEDKRETYIISKILAENFNFIFITQDDTQYKNPFQCNINFIKFLRKFNSNFTFIEDRKEAIKKALIFTKKGDALFILGRGDQKYMKVRMNKKIPFNDIEITKELVNEIYLKRYYL